MAFVKAVKQKLFLRAGLYGPSGSGKTYSALLIATGIADAIGGRIAFICSEHGSARKYADRFDFDVNDLTDKSVDGYLKAIREARTAGYRVLVIDSMTHAWQELLEEVDRIAKTGRHQGNKWSAWSEGTPKQRELVEAILSYPGHTLATMRSKTEWVTVETSNGKKAPNRVGLAPEQGKGIEYEFDLLLELTEDNAARVIKDRTGKFQGRTIEKPGADFGKELAAWLDEGEPAPPPPKPAPASALADVSALLGALEVDNGDRVAKVSAIVGRTVTKKEPLTADEADAVIRALAAEVDTREEEQRRAKDDDEEQSIRQGEAA